MIIFMIGIFLGVGIGALAAAIIFQISYCKMMVRFKKEHEEYLRELDGNW